MALGAGMMGSNLSRWCGGCAVLLVMSGLSVEGARGDENAAAIEWSANLVARKSPGLTFPELLDATKLDYSVESLKAVDDYLDAVHADQRLDASGHASPAAMNPRQLNAIVFPVGAYVGEVIRRASANSYAWYGHKDWVTAHPETLQVLGKDPTLATALVLGTSTGKIMLPFGKVLKFLANGRDDSTHWLAVVALKKDDAAPAAAK